MGQQCGLSQFYQVCLCFFFNLLSSQMYDFTSMIFTVPLWGSEVANSKTEIHLTHTAVEVGMQRHIYAMSLLLLNARVTLLRHYCGWWGSNPRPKNPWSVDDAIC